MDRWIDVEREEVREQAGRCLEEGWINELIEEMKNKESATFGRETIEGERGRKGG